MSLCIAVLGATGGTGLQLVRQALERGHTVHALVRNPGKLTEKHDNLKIIETDILDEKSLASGMSGCDVVMSALGAGVSFFSQVTLYSQSLHAIASGMSTAGINRLIVCTSCEPRDGMGKWAPMRVLVSVLLGKVLEDMKRMETSLEEQYSDIINYTAVRPPSLTNDDKLDAPVKAIVNTWNSEFACTMPRANVAHFMLDCLTDPSWDRQMIVIGMPK